MCVCDGVCVCLKYSETPRTKSDRLDKMQGELRTRITATVVTAKLQTGPFGQVMRDN